MASKEQLSIHDRFKSIRTDLLNLTQKELAEQLETTQANISQIENGECLPTVNFVARIADRYPDVNFNWLFYNEGQPKRSMEKATEKITKSQFAKLNNELEQLRKDNSNILALAGKKKK